MLVQLVNGTANFVQNNVKLIRESYPVAVVTDGMRNMMGYKTKEEDEKDKDEKDDKKQNIDTFDDPPPPPSYLSIMGMLNGSIKGQKFSWENWLFFVIGIILTLMIISATLNYMIMLPFHIRLFTGFYLLFMGLTSDFTQLNLIYFTAIGYLILAMYRYYLQTLDPAVHIIPFNWDSLFPLRTAKGPSGFIEKLLKFFTYLPMGAVGTNYMNLVRTTDEYITQQKATIPDYDSLKGQLDPLYQTFENHMININLPGYLPESPPDNAKNVAIVATAATATTAAVVASVAAKANVKRQTNNTAAATAATAATAAATTAATVAATKQQQ